MNMIAQCGAARILYCLPQEDGYGFAQRGNQSER